MGLDTEIESLTDKLLENDFVDIVHIDIELSHFLCVYVG